MLAILPKASLRSCIRPSLLRYVSTVIIDQIPPEFTKLEDNMVPLMNNITKRPAIQIQFHSEPLGLLARNGYPGFPILKLGERIGPQEQYTLVRKLGWGATCSTWLARHKHHKNFVSIKVLTAESTKHTRNGYMKEIETMTRLSQHGSSPYCLDLLETFNITPKDGTENHICVVTPYHDGDVFSVAKSLGSFAFPLKLAKRILLHVLRGLAHAHKCGVIHTDIKHDNIFVEHTMSDEEIEQWIKADPSRLHPPEHSLSGVVQAAVSQPLPMQLKVEELMKRKFILADYGYARLIDEDSDSRKTIPLVTPFARRPPELFLGAAWSEKIDIWIFGYFVYDLCVGKRLFWEANSEEDDSPQIKVETMLHSMMAFTGETFEPHLLQNAKHCALYFEEDGSLLNLELPEYEPIEDEIQNVTEKGSDLFLNEPERIATGNFIRTCLRLDPKKRPSADELLQDPWFMGVE